MMKNGRTIRIKSGVVNIPVVEHINTRTEFEESIFTEQYVQALDALNNLYSAQSQNSNLSNHNISQEESPNNIIAFVGERGSGKTSCMSSVAELLTPEKLRIIGEYAALEKHRFESIGIIDPSYFDQTHNIVAMVVARLYKTYRDFVEQGQTESGCFEVQRKLEQAFARAQRSMQCLLGKNETSGDYDDVENLTNLSQAVDLKKDIADLVKEYLKFRKHENGILLLCIDDIDLNISQADEMAEQIRKYLVSPQIVILLAAKLEQLGTIKSLHYTQKYETLIEHNRMSFDVIEEMTGQYLTKLVPHNQRIYLPTSEIYLNATLKIDGKTMPGNSVRQAVPELIFKKTRYLFYNSGHRTSYIVPTNLRKLCQIVELLQHMPDYQDEGQSSNKETFKKYLFGTWIQDNITSVEDRKICDEIWTGWRDNMLNKATLTALQGKYTKWFQSLEERKTAESNKSIKRARLEELLEIINPQNLEFNISVGDIMGVLFLLQQEYDTPADRRLFFLINSIYSMALYESYDAMTETTERPEEAAKAELVLRYDPFDEMKLCDYKRLIAGRLCNLRLLNAMQWEDGKVSRTERLINYETVTVYLANVVQEWEAFNKKSPIEQEHERDTLKYKIQLAEFFLLCLSRGLEEDAKADRNQDTCRQSDTVYYDGEFRSKSNVWFDLGAFFYNVIDIKRCYSRVKDSGKKLFELADRESGYGDGNSHYLSLWGDFKHRAIERKEGIGYNELHCWQSWACIRNAEIIQDLYQWMISKRSREGDNMARFEAFFRALQDYKIRTYDKEDEAPGMSKELYYKIDYSFVSVIAELFAKTNSATIGDDFEKMFKPKSSPLLLKDDPKLLPNRSAKNVSTIKRKIKELQSKAYNANEEIINRVFAGYGSKMAYEDLPAAIKKINNLIIASEDGESETSSQTAVPAEEPAGDTQEME